MKHVAVVGTRSIFGRVTAITNEAEILARRGVEAIVIVQEGVAVVADNPWRAEQAARAVTFIEEAPENAGLDTAALVAQMEAALDAGNRFSTVQERGDAEAALTGAAPGEVIEARYFVPFLAHAPMETPSVSIWREGGRVHAAAGVQSPLPARLWVADRLGLDAVSYTHLTLPTTPYV